MHLRWNNGVLTVGRLLWCDGYGLELAWGRRDLLGEDVHEGDALFADRVQIVLATGHGARVHGGVVRAALARVFKA